MASIAHHVGSLVWVPEKGIDGTLFRSKKVLPRSIPAHSYVCVYPALVSHAPCKALGRRAGPVLGSAEQTAQVEFQGSMLRSPSPCVLSERASKLTEAQLVLYRAAKQSVQVPRRPYHLTVSLSRALNSQLRMRGTEACAQRCRAAVQVALVRDRVAAVRAGTVEQALPEGPHRYPGGRKACARAPSRPLHHAKTCSDRGGPVLSGAERAVQVARWVRGRVAGLRAGADGQALLEVVTEEGAKHALAPAEAPLQNERDDTVDDLVKSDFLHEPGWAAPRCFWVDAASCVSPALSCCRPSGATVLTTVTWCTPVRARVCCTSCCGVVTGAAAVSALLTLLHQTHGMTWCAAAPVGCGCSTFDSEVLHEQGTLPVLGHNARL